MIFLPFAHSKLKDPVFGKDSWTADFGYIAFPLYSHGSNLGTHCNVIIGLFNLLK